MRISTVTSAAAELLFLKRSLTPLRSLPSLPSHLISESPGPLRMRAPKHIEAIPTLDRILLYVRLVDFLSMLDSASHDRWHPELSQSHAQIKMRPDSPASTPCPVGERFQRGVLRVPLFLAPGIHKSDKLSRGHSLPGARGGAWGLAGGLARIHEQIRDS